MPFVIATLIVIPAFLVAGAVMNFLRHDRELSPDTWRHLGWPRLIYRARDPWQMAGVGFLLASTISCLGMALSGQTSVWPYAAFLLFATFFVTKWLIEYYW